MNEPFQALRNLPSADEVVRLLYKRDAFKKAPYGTNSLATWFANVAIHDFFRTATGTDGETHPERGMPDSEQAGDAGGSGAPPRAVSVCVGRQRQGVGQPPLLVPRPPAVVRLLEDDGRRHARVERRQAQGVCGGPHEADPRVASHRRVAAARAQLCGGAVGAALPRAVCHRRGAVPAGAAHHGRCVYQHHPPRLRLPDVWRDRAGRVGLLRAAAGVRRRRGGQHVHLQLQPHLPLPHLHPGGVVRDGPAADRHGRADAHTAQRHHQLGVGRVRPEQRARLNPRGAGARLAARHRGSAIDGRSHAQHLPPPLHERLLLLRGHDGRRPGHRRHAAAALPGRHRGRRARRRLPGREVHERRVGAALHHRAGDRRGRLRVDPARPLLHAGLGCVQLHRVGL
mmetsp:Transcript_9921/g.31447  ORF Transcript_9921/g.31447 Transcript_9921/m.31447 type:complete len:398 (-) Transcript_9921:384-1577(-)